MARKLTHPEIVHDCMSKYNERIKLINQRRDLWTNATRARLKDTLDAIVVEANNQHFLVQENISAKNWESVNLVLTAQPSGIIIDRKVVLQSASALIFSQIYNGKIMVCIQYPSIDGIVEKSADLVLGYYEPSSLTEDVIMNSFKSYMDELNKWENPKH